MQTGKIRHQRPAKVMHRRDYFRQRHAPEGTDEFILERLKAHNFETKLPDIIGKLCSGGHELTEDELILFILHLEFQWLAVPKQAEFFKACGERCITNVSMRVPEFADGFREGLWRVQMKDEFRFDVLHEIIKSGKIPAFLSQMVWNVWDAPNGYTFVTSDNPVTIFNHSLRPPEVAGNRLSGINTALPLDEYPLP